MITIAGIRFRKAGKIYYFDPVGLELNAGENVIVETVRGIEFGTVVLPAKEVDEKEVVQPLKKVIRVATPDDHQTEDANREREREAFKVCHEKIRKHELEMKLIDCEYTFDNNKLLFYFTADGRVDFRDLVKDLASVFKTRIELRQIGVRDETKMMGSIGICGRTLCCHAHLSDFHPVSIKMAKDQNLSLNPTKISGVCGRLMCCLKYEEETYRELNKKLPRNGERVKISDTGEIAEVINTNIIRQLVKLVVRKENGDPEIIEKHLDELELKRQGRFQNNRVKEEKVNPEEAKALKELEASEKADRSGDDKKQNRSRNNRNRNNRNTQNKQKQDDRRSQQNKDRKSSGEGNKKTGNKQGGQKPQNKNAGGNRPQRDDEKKSSNRNRRPRNKNNQGNKQGGQKPQNRQQKPQNKNKEQ